MFTLINPTKTADLSAYAVTSLPCPTCKETATIEITPESLFLYNNGANAQTVLCNFNVDVRERFISGMCGDCWNAMFEFDYE